MGKIKTREFGANILDIIGRMDMLLEERLGATDPELVSLRKNGLALNNPETKVPKIGKKGTKLSTNAKKKKQKKPTKRRFPCDQCNIW